MLVAERKRMTGFGRTLWRFMQERPAGELNRTELAEMLTGHGFDVEPAHVSAWMNGDRMPPPGFPYYSALVLKLNDKERCELTWAYLQEYKDRIKGRSKKGQDQSEERDPKVTDQDMEDALRIEARREARRQAGGREDGRSSRDRRV
jgi:hypothetical protein